MTDTKDQQADPEWFSFDDGEIRSRLLRRGVEPVYAKGLVRDRAQAEAIAEITTILGVKYDTPLEVPIEKRSRR